MQLQEEDFLIGILGVILLMFFLAGLRKIQTFQSTLVNMTSKIETKFGNFNETILKIILIAVIFIEVLMPVLIIHGVRRRKPSWMIAGSGTLIVFTILATYLYHFPPTGSKYYPFISNLTTVGALLLIIFVAVTRTPPVQDYSGSFEDDKSFLGYA